MRGYKQDESNEGYEDRQRQYIPRRGIYVLSIRPCLSITKLYRYIRRRVYSSIYKYIPSLYIINSFFTIEIENDKRCRNLELSNKKNNEVIKECILY